MARRINRSVSLPDLSGTKRELQRQTSFPSLKDKTLSFQGTSPPLFTNITKDEDLSLSSDSLRRMDQPSRKDVADDSGSSSSETSDAILTPEITTADHEIDLLHISPPSPDFGLDDNLPPSPSRPRLSVKEELLELKEFFGIQSQYNPLLDNYTYKPLRALKDTFGFKEYPLKHSTNFIYEGLIEKDKVLYFIESCGHRSKEVRLYLDWLCSIVEKKFSSVERVWAGYEPQFTSPLVFVAEVIEDELCIFQFFWKFKIIQRLKGHVSDEAKYVSNMEIREGLVFTDEEQIAIKKCLTKHTVTLMKSHSNLLIVSAAKLKSKRHGSKDAVYEKTTCIVFYVHIKGIIPFGENAFPTELDGFPVDVREGTFKTYSNPSDFHERLMMGCQIVTAYNMVCSLGGFIELESGNIGCLTCFHAFATEESVADFNKDPVNRSFLKKEVFQPHLSSDFEFGRLVNFIRNPGDSANIGVDAAVIEITKTHRHPNTGEFPDATADIAGFSSCNPMVFSSGKIVERLEDIPIPCTVVKYGAGTGHTIGLLRLAGPAVHSHSSSFYPDDKIQLHQQFEVFSIKNQDFADEGDSGALVFMVTKMGGDMQVRALGLLVGGTDYGTTIVTPIWAVLNKLNLPLRLLSFESLVEVAENPASQRLERIESDVNVLKQTTETTKQTVSSLENKLDSTDRKQDERSATIENIVSSVENKVSSLENKIDMIDREQAERSTSIKNELKTHHSDLSKKIDVLLNVVTSIK